MLTRNQIVACVAAIFILAVLVIVPIKGSNEAYRGNTTRFQFQKRARDVVPKSIHTLSRNGPYIDVHLKDMNEENPIGETYYQRPLSSYDEEKKILSIYLDIEQPTVHMNSNTVCTDIGYGGVITISDFVYGEYNPDSMVDVNIAVCNKTCRDIIGFHVHDGELSNTKSTQGFTHFGPIVYFIKTTEYWIRKATELSKAGKFPLPLGDALANDRFKVDRT